MTYTLVTACLPAVASRHARLDSGHGISTAADLCIELLDGVLDVLDPLDDNVYAVRCRAGMVTLDQELLVQGLDLLGHAVVQNLAGRRWLRRSHCGRE